jgi:anionic cell wall polymer biosynthesis LytR-Cps2A-Psr (LCP) family protein
MDVVRSNFGVDVDHYVRVDLVGFVRIVDAMGGVDLDVPNALIDYEYPTYDYGTRVVEFAAGPQHMDGEAALAYARIRHGSSDFQRAERQQLVVQAIITRLMQPSAWVKLPAVLAAVNESVDTDMTPVDLARLAPTVLLVGPSNFDREVIEGEMVQPYTTDGGASVQLPVWAAINPVLLRMFGQ